MLKKLLKYDLKWSYKVLNIFYFLLLVFAVFSRILSNINNSLFFTIINKITSFLVIVLIIGSFIYTLIRSWQRFYTNMYKDEAYLTHTLPIKIETIYLAKILSSIICLLTTIIISLISIFLCFYSKDIFNVIKESLELTVSTYNTTIINLLFVIVIVFSLEILSFQLIGDLGIIIGHRFNKNKLSKSLVISFIIYIVSNIFTFLLIIILAIFNKDLMNIINTTEMVNINVIKLIMVLAVLIYFVYNIIYYFIGIWQLRKGVNVD